MNQDPNKLAYDSLCCYTLPLRDPSFIHQHVVDAFAAQNAKPGDKPIGLTFALIGLYLHVEKGFNGRQVQLAHMKLAKKRRSNWPALQLPDDRGDVDASAVLKAASGPERDAMIHRWCESVWAAFSENREEVDGLLRQYGIL